MKAQTPLIQVEGLKKYFPIRKSLRGVTGYVKAVDGISLTIDRGEIFGLVGESGCGKSTIGRSIINLIAPTAGRVAYNGTVLFDVENKTAMDKKTMAALRRDLQIIFQDPFASLDPRMNVGAIISEGILKHRLMPRRDAVDRAGQLLELCGMDASGLYKYPHEFSGGQRQRIGIARALALNPSFIVADEPIAALDVSVQAQVLMLLQELKEQFGLTYLFISHDLGVIRYFCDRVGVMYLGSMAEMGSSEALFSHTLHPYTKALFSAIPVEDPTEKRERILLHGEIPSPADPPPGCKFHTRCPQAVQRCREERPQLLEAEPGHFVACHLVHP